MTIRERLYWLIYWLQQKTGQKAQGLGFDFRYYLDKALRGEYHGPNQAYAYGITTTPVFVEPGTKYYRVIYVGHLKPGENDGGHHLRFDVVDTEGYRIQGARLIVWNNNQRPVYAVLDKPAHETGNVPMWWTSTLSVAVDPEWSGVKSDRAEGFHTRWPDEGPDVTLGHHSYFVVFQETVSGGERQPLPVTEPDEPTLEERITAVEARVTTLEGKTWKV